MSDMLCKHYKSGRLFVEKESDIPKMLDIIREIDPEAFEKFPNSLVCVFSEEGFDDMPFEELSETNLDMARVLHKAWENGIKCFVVFGNTGDLNNYHMKFGYKQYGRIFVEKESDILCLKCLIMGMDSFEYDYLPKNLITVFN